MCLGGVVSEGGLSCFNSRALYLFFHGETFTGKYWNEKVMRAYDMFYCNWRHTSTSCANPLDGASYHC